MAETSPQALPAVREARLVIREARDYNITVANVTDMTERAKQAIENVAEITHVRPKRVVMRYTLAGTALSGVIGLGMMWMTYALSGKLDAPVVIAAMLITGAPFGITAIKVLPKMIDHAAGSGG